MEAKEAMDRAVEDTANRLEAEHAAEAAKNEAAAKRKHMAIKEKMVQRSRAFPIFSNLLLLIYCITTHDIS